MAASARVWRGPTLLNGAGAPAADTGLVGDAYLDTTSHVLYGPKTSGGWGAGFALRDPSLSTDLASETSARAAADALLAPKARVLTAGAGLAGGGDLSADRTFDVNVDGATLEINADTVRVKDGGVTVAKLAFDPATQAELDAETAARAAAVSAEASARAAGDTSSVGTAAGLALVLGG